ncbi:FG-GAP-like repeat-containing protein [Streptomyces spiramyceticus]|uniref:FG-GAP-like repeat-containing protein n=1 Tax=Streptomyces spiramyceticus TaxID=299717 RepID=UPI00237A4148|nr:FG-GAP-like repeat-containing protein [Streptomyces spiramyceticus]
MRTRTLVLVTTVAAALLSSAPTASAAPAKYPDDFNGDGYRDIAVGSPWAQIGSKRQAGHVSVLYGSASGTSTSLPFAVHQGRVGVPGAAEAGDEFGQVVASADLDRDGYADLVAGAPSETVGTRTQQGAVSVVWGSSAGLNQGASISNKKPTAYGHFGSALTAGDFTGDGAPDLVVAEGEGLRLYRGPFARTGAPKSSSYIGLGGKGALRLVAGKINKNAYVDLVVVNETNTRVLKGTSAGLSMTAKTMPGSSNSSYGGRTPATVGDFDGDGYGDVVVSDGWAYGNGVFAAGKVTVAYGSATGLSTTRATKTITQKTEEVPGTPEEQDHFGYSVSAGDVNGDGRADLLVGVPGENGVTLLKGSSTGLTGVKSRWLDANSSGMPSEYTQFFGHAVRLTDTNRDQRADAVIADPSVNGYDGALLYVPSDGHQLTGTGASIVYPPRTESTEPGLHNFGMILAD